MIGPPNLLTKEKGIKFHASAWHIHSIINDRHTHDHISISLTMITHHVYVLRIWIGFRTEPCSFHNLSISKEFVKNPWYQTEKGLVRSPCLPRRNRSITSNHNVCTLSCLQKISQSQNMDRKIFYQWNVKFSRSQSISCVCHQITQLSPD